MDRALEHKDTQNTAEVEFDGGQTIYKQQYWKNMFVNWLLDQ